jgi:non-specific serine/threonine protein kinase
LHEALPPTFVFWRGVAQRLFTALCHNPNLQDASTITIPKPSGAEWSALAEGAPPMMGLEYLQGAVLARVWDELDTHVHAAIAQDRGGAVAYLKSCNPVWNAVGRVTFHLAENRRNPAYPFAFLATYTHRISEQGKVQHLPLGRALEEYAGAKNRAALAALLSPVQWAAGHRPGEPAMRTGPGGSGGFDYGERGRAGGAVRGAAIVVRGAGV